MIRPSEVNVLGIIYRITYVSKPSDVDLHERESLWGQIDYWTRTIRVYDRDRSFEDLLSTILHEVIHGIATELHLKSLCDKDNHDELDVLSLALADVFIRNKWIAEETA